MIAVSPDATPSEILNLLGWRSEPPPASAMHVGRAIFDADGVLVGNFLAPQLIRHLRRERLIEFTDADYAAQFDALLDDHDRRNRA